MSEKELKKYSYIKKPFAKNGWYSFFASLAVVILTVATIYMAVRSRGESPLAAGVLGISCILFSLMGIVSAVLGIREQETAHLFAYIGGALSVLMLLSWVGIVVIGAAL